MVKLIVVNKRKKGVTQEAFRRAWLNHGELLISTPTFARHMAKYSQSHIVSSSLQLPGDPEIGGISELWFDSIEELSELVKEPCVKEITMPDTVKFIDFENSPNYLCEEILIYNKIYHK